MDADPAPGSPSPKSPSPADSSPGNSPPGPPPSLQTALGDLVASGVISPAQSSAMLRAARMVPRRLEAWITEALGYLGGTLMIAGIGTLLALTWNDQGRTFWTSLAFGVAVLFLVLGQLLSQGPEFLRPPTSKPVSGVRRRIAGVLLALSAIATTIAMWIMIGENDHHLWIAPALGTLVAAAGYVTVRALPPVLACIFLSFLWVVHAASELDDHTKNVPLTGMAIMLLGVIWTALGHKRLAVPEEVSMGVGAALTVLGGQQCLDLQGYRAWAYVLTTCAAIGCLVMYRIDKVLVLFVVGIVGLAIVVPEVILDVTESRRVTAITLLFLGAALLTAAGVGLRRRRTAA